MVRSPCHDRPDLPLGHVSIGDCAFSLRPILLTTVLGSCVCATFHHPGRRSGGMFHAMLPDRGMRRNAERTPVCTFADMAVEAMVERFRVAGMPPNELVVKLFGGANTMEACGSSVLNDMLDVGAKNVRSALAALAVHGLTPKVSDVMGIHGRKLYFATATGEVWLSYLTPELARKYLAERKRC